MGMFMDVEPLPSELWFARLRVIAQGELPGIENSLRHAAHLAQLAPPPFREQLRLRVSEEEYEALLAARQFDEAARHLVAHPELVPSADKKSPSRLVEVSCMVLDHAVIGRGKSVAEAILDAWTRRLLSFATGLEGAGSSGPNFERASRMRAIGARSMSAL